MEDVIFRHFFAFWYCARVARGCNFADAREQKGAKRGAEAVDSWGRGGAAARGTGLRWQLAVMTAAKPPPTGHG